MKKIIVLLVTALLMVIFAGCMQTTDGIEIVIPKLMNGDFSQGADYSRDGWVPNPNPDDGSGLFWNTWKDFGIDPNLSRYFKIETKPIVTVFPIVSSIEQLIMLPVGTYKITSKILWSFGANGGDMVKIEVLNKEKTITTKTADITNTDAQDLNTDNFTLTDETEVTIKITFNLTAASAGTAIDDVVLIKVR